jgi:hypothetical protein
MRAARSSALLLLAVLVGVASCGREESGLGPTRGYVLISLDTLSARHLGAYGYERDTSPFFDRLAAEGALFENAVVQYPSTLVSHVSILTGLYPQEHGVYPPSSVLSPLIPSLPDQLQAAGYSTAGHTEAGYVSKDFGFDRGFDEFRALAGDSRQAERTFARGEAFLERLGEGERFFLFLHTYAVHDPYQPPEGYDQRFWDAELPEVTDSSGSFLRDVNMGRHRVGADTVAFYRAQYDAEIRYLDGVLEGFLGTLDELGLRDETTLVITADHGEEFQQHGKLAHSQVYPETLHVPLLILHPALSAGRRVPELVQSIDIAPTLYELAGIEPGVKTSGRSLVPQLRGGRAEGAAEAPARAYAEVFDQENQKTLIEVTPEGPLQYLTSLVVSEPDGTWVTRSAVLDTTEPALELRLVSFNEPRQLSIEIDGRPLESLTVGTGWQTVPIALSEGGRHRLSLDTEECGVPLWLGLGSDTRCLSFKLQGAELRRSELYDLGRDPGALVDLSGDQRDLLERMAEELRRYRWQLRAEPGQQELSNDTLENLRALGYVN